MFKIQIISLIGGFLFIFYQYSQNGRYQNYNETIQWIQDARTGKIYKIVKGEPKVFRKAIRE